MRNTAAVRPESPKVTIEESKTMSSTFTPLKLPALRPDIDEGGKNDFSLPSPKGGMVELPGMTIDIPGESKDDDSDGFRSNSFHDEYPLYHLKGRKHILPEQVKCERESLNSGDVFVLDLRSHPLYCIVQWTGAEGNRREKAAARLFCDKLHNEVSL
jgi:hypothetical protein